MLRILKLPAAQIFVRTGELFSRACAIHLYSARAEIAESLLWAAARDRDTAPDRTAAFWKKRHQKLLR